MQFDFGCKLIVTPYCLTNITLLNVFRCDTSLSQWVMLGKIRNCYSYNPLSTIPNSSVCLCLSQKSVLPYLGNKCASKDEFGGQRLLVFHKY